MLAGKPNHGGGVEKAQPEIDNGLNIDAVTTARGDLAKMLESK
jgi:hypothetical protein